MEQHNRNSRGQQLHTLDRFITIHKQPNRAERRHNPAIAEHIALLKTMSKTFEPNQPYVNKES